MFISQLYKKTYLLAYAYYQMFKKIINNKKNNCSIELYLFTRGGLKTFCFSEE